MTTFDVSTQSSSTKGTQTPGRTVSIVGIVLGALGLLFTLLLGIPGLVCSIVGASKGNRLGYIGIVVSVICTVAGMAIGYVAYS